MIRWQEKVSENQCLFEGRVSPDSLALVPMEVSDSMILTFDKLIAAVPIWAISTLCTSGKIGFNAHLESWPFIDSPHGIDQGRCLCFTVLASSPGLYI